MSGGHLLESAPFQNPESMFFTPGGGGLVWGMRGLNLHPEDYCPLPREGRGAVEKGRVVGE